MKMMIIMRTDLNMRKGKMVAQGGHAVEGIITEWYNPELHNEPFKTWMQEGRKKICVGVDSLEELVKLEKESFSYGFFSHKVIDSGLTEFNGIPTVTCLAIGPAEDKLIDKITGHLKLL